MTLKEAINIAIQLMDEVPLKGSDARMRGMAQVELMKLLEPKQAEVKDENAN